MATDETNRTARNGRKMGDARSAARKAAGVRRSPAARSGRRIGVRAERRPPTTTASAERGHHEQGPHRLGPPRRVDEARHDHRRHPPRGGAAAQAPVVARLVAQLAQRERVDHGPPGRDAHERDDHERRQQPRLVRAQQDAHAGRRRQDGGQDQGPVAAQERVRDEAPHRVRDERREGRDAQHGADLARVQPDVVSCGTFQGSTKPSEKP